MFYKIKLQCRLFGIGDLSVCGYILVKLTFNPRKTRRILLFLSNKINLKSFEKFPDGT